MQQPVFSEPCEYRAALYMRLSRDDGDSGESESIVNQRKILRDFAREQGFFVAGEYADDGWSGTNFNRPAFKQMMEDIETKKINCVITKDLSRLGRDHVMVGYYTETFFPEHGIRYIAINDRVDSNEGDSDIAPFMNVFNEFHAKQTSKKVRSVFAAKFKEGECHYAFPPMGYRKDPSRKNHLVPDEETRWIIEKMFQLAEEGNGAWAVRMWLFDHKVMTPGYRAYRNWGAYAKTYAGAPEERRYQWGIANVKKILRDPVYIGTLVHYRTRDISFKNHKKKKQPPSRQYMVKHAHEPIISEETFQRVQEQIEKRRRSTAAGAPHLFAGIAVCADCGGYMRFGSNRISQGREYHYLCCGRKSEIGTFACTPHNTPYEAFCDAILKRIQSLYKQVKLDRRAIAEKLAGMSDAAALAECRKKRQELEALKARKEELSKVLSKLYEDLIGEKISNEIFSVMSDKFQSEHREASEKIHALEQELKREDDPGRAEKLIELVDSLSYPTVLTRELVNALIEKIAIHEPIGPKYARGKPQEIEIFWRFLEPEKPEVLFK